MNLSETQKRLADEFDAYYSDYESGAEMLLNGVKALDASNKGRSSLYRKSAIHEYLAEHTPIHVFDHTKIILDVPVGRSRYTWGGLQSHVGSYMHEATKARWLDPYEQAVCADRENGFMHGWSPVGFDHHCPSYDLILNEGIETLIRRAERATEGDCTAEQREFYKAAVRSNQALLRLAERFAALADQLASSDTSDTIRRNHEGVRDIFTRVPRFAPQSFCEALAAIFFYREAVGSLEGIGISTFGHLDRLLYPFYLADVRSGAITRSEAKQLICDLLIYTEIRFNTAEVYKETSTTIELGGVDREGNLVFNEVTKMILESVYSLRTIGTKINCRISHAHPDEYLSMIAKIQCAAIPTVMMHNDDVLIPCRTKQGQDIRDARLYLGCGCHEIVLAGTEVCTRADTWINPSRIFVETLKNNENAADFEALYTAFLSDAQTYCDRIVNLKNQGESHWHEYDPLPLFSASIIGCLESGKDITAGGARYNTTSLSLTGAATLIDSLYAVKTLVWDEKRTTVSELNRMIERDFEGDEHLRQYILNRLPKHGSGNPEMSAFSARVLSDLSRLAGQANARGGKYLPAFYPHDIYRHLGKRSCATPDGRRKGVALSRGISPSEFIGGISPTDLINSIRSIDFTEFAESFVTELTLPTLREDENSVRILISLIRAFLDAKGSSLQFNTLNTEDLLAARQNPENHKSLYVRVCGYSAAFVTLSEQTQNEIILRAVRAL